LREEFASGLPFGRIEPLVSVGIELLDQFAFGLFEPESTGSTEAGRTSKTRRRSVVGLDSRFRGLEARAEGKDMEQQGPDEATVSSHGIYDAFSRAKVNMSAKSPATSGVWRQPVTNPDPFQISRKNARACFVHPPFRLVRDGCATKEFTAPFSGKMG
jgi:hypothetical protein